MSYKQIKWLILFVPTITIGIWEYVRHTILLPYLSMETGNLLAPVIIFLVTMTLTVKLFSILESIQDELNRERNVKAALEERERIARELHDGIAQSLFLLSVQMDRLEKGNAADSPNRREEYEGIRKTAQQMNDYVRQSISNLRYPPSAEPMPWLQSLHNMLDDFTNETGIRGHFQWDIPEADLSSKDKVELYACVREALLNVRKHAQAGQVWVSGKAAARGWICTIMDDGRGFREDPLTKSARYGLKIMKERVDEMGWDLHIGMETGQTVVSIGSAKEGGR